MAERLNLDQIQGIVKSGYTHLPAGAYLLLTIDPARRVEAGAWFAALVPSITSCRRRRDEESLNVAFTCAGLRRLGVPAEMLDTFSVPFIDGMTSPRRASLLGDADAQLDAPLRWGGSTDAIDALLMVYARDDASLTQRLSGLEKSATASGIGSRPLRSHVYADRREHFGFVDGISQPVLDGLRPKEKQLVPERDVVKDGEFILGYTNEYGYAAEAPRLGPNGDLGRDGSYLVFRQLTQDVAGFAKFLDAQAGGKADERDLLAAKMVGRWKNGAPLVKAPYAEERSYAATSPDHHARVRANDFGFAADPEGARCPLGAHIRRANPRDGSALDTPAESLRRTARHRLLRRGRSYGPRIDDPNAADKSERGLYFIALCADIERQFEFVQQTWINNPAFNDLDEVDPLVGRQTAGATLTIQGAVVRRRIKGMQTFVAFVGGAYFFVPSIAAFDWLAANAAARRSRAGA